MKRAKTWRSGRERARGFMLMEALLAVTIFAFGVLVLGKCVNGCLSAMRLKEEDALARRALENRWAEIESGAVPVGKNTAEELKPPFDGMTLKTTVVPVEKENEKQEKVEGIYAITLSVTWGGEDEEQSKELLFYYYPSAGNAAATGTTPTR
ncbi:MAG: hypothetical protein K8R23_00225 [Chthoniobacter sp.]|nr:hypothetical protein [Chthoniobacter sp.]